MKQQKKYMNEKDPEYVKLMGSIDWNLLSVDDATKFADAIVKNEKKSSGFRTLSDQLIILGLMTAIHLFVKENTLLVYSFFGGMGCVGLIINRFSMNKQFGETATIMEDLASKYPKR